jgi:prefoldin subunit 5
LSQVLCVCESYVVTPVEASRDELEEIIASLREEITRLKEEIRRIRRETNEVPPHYL